LNTKRILDFGLVAAISVTVLAPLAASLHNLGGEYDPGLALQSLSVVAIVWYVYFLMYGTLRKDSPRLVLALGRAGKNRFDVIVENASPHRDVLVRQKFEILRGGSTKVLEPEVLSGSPEGAVHLPPGTDHREEFGVDPLRLVEGSKYGPGVETAEPPEMYVRGIAFWEDDQGFIGTVGPRYWELHLEPAGVQELRIEKDIEAAFGTYEPLTLE